MIGGGPGNTSPVCVVGTSCGVGRRTHATYTQRQRSASAAERSLAVSRLQSMIARIGCGLFGLGATGILAERLPVAFHEAGHAIIGAHLAESGIRYDNGVRGAISLPAAKRRLLLRFATITPRETDKGQTYFGETKLVLRWREMHSFLEWHSQETDAVRDGSSTEGEHSAGGLHDGAPALECGKSASTPAAMIGLGRIAYLMGGRVAQDLLSARCMAFSWNKCGNSAQQQVGQLMAAPGMASGDLRKAQQVADATLDHPSPQCSAQANVRTLQHHAVLSAAYAFAEAVLRSRWSEVCALSGALCVRGTVDGSQLASLLKHHRHSLLLPHPLASSPAPTAASTSERLWTLIALYPFLFGCVFAWLHWPTADPILPGPGLPMLPLADWSSSEGSSSE